MHDGLIVIKICRGGAEPVHQVFVVDACAAGGSQQRGDDFANSCCLAIKLKSWINEGAAALDTDNLIFWRKLEAKFLVPDREPRSVATSLLRSNPHRSSIAVHKFSVA